MPAPRQERGQGQEKVVDWSPRGSVERTDARKKDSHFTSSTKVKKAAQRESRRANLNKVTWINGRQQKQVGEKKRRTPHQRKNPSEE